MKKLKTDHQEVNEDLPIQSVHEINKSFAVRSLLGIVRDRNALTSEYVHAADRLMRIIAEEALGVLAHLKGQKEVETLTGSKIQVPESLATADLCVVSIMRSGDVLLEAVRSIVPGISVGKLLIQRDESDPEKKPRIFYTKLPNDIATKTVILCDPMLATGGSACLAISELKNKGCLESRILFANAVSCPEGISRLRNEYPEVRIVTAAIDSHLDENKYIVPGLGDFGDRYYSTFCE